MTAPDPSYRKLPGRGLSWAGLGRLWRAEDHLLEVNSLFLSERYRRFFFKDISALVIRRTRVRFAWNLVHGVLGIGGTLAAGGLWWGGLMSGEEALRVMLWIFAGMTGPFALFFLVLLFLNILLGPTCRCHLQTTSAGWYPLAAPSRLRPARRFLAEIIPLVEAAQSANGARSEERGRAARPHPNSPPGISPA